MAHTPVLIGLHGKMRSGKDTTFGIAQEWAVERGLHAARRGFADLLKQSFARLFYPDMNHVEAVQWCDRVKFHGGLKLDVRLDNNEGSTHVVREEVFVSGRQALQRFGTESHRDVFGDDFWVDALLPHGTQGPFSMHFSPDADPAVVQKARAESQIPLWVKSFTDGPFAQDAPNFAFVTDVRFENEARRIRELGGEVWQIIRETDSTDSHSSETPLPADLVDRIVWNNADLPNLHEIVVGIMESIITP